MASKKRCFSDIEDCIFCLDKLLFDPDIKSQILNIGPDEEEVSINKLYEIISNKMQHNKPAIYEKDRPNEVKNAICSSEKARALLGYKTSVTLDKSIDKIVKYIKSEGPLKFDYNLKLEIVNKFTPKTWSEKNFNYLFNLFK